MSDHTASAAALQPAANLPLIEEENASPDVRDLYANFRERFGRPAVPAILKCFATHPPLLKHMMGLADSMLFSDGALGRTNKELVATFLSARNRCPYCADSHGASLLRQTDGSIVLLEAAMACDLSAPALAPSQQALLQFVAKINDDAGRLAHADVAALRSMGWTDLQIAEAIHLAALFACFNRVVSAFGVPSQELLPRLTGDSSVMAEAQ